MVVAEDNHINREVLLAFLEDLGIRDVVTVTDGLQAVEHVRAHGADVVLMDNFMPVMDGITATRLLREDALPVRVVVVTADVSSDALARCEEAGADAVLAKPFDRAQLGATLARVLAHLRPADDDAGPIGARAHGTSLWTVPVVDVAAVEALAARPRGRTTMLVRLVKLFDEQVPTLLTDVRRAADEGDLEGLRRAAHTLVSAVATLGLRRAAEVAARTDRSVAALLQAPTAGRGADAGELAAWAELVVNEVEEGRRALGVYLGGAGSLTRPGARPEAAGVPAPRAGRPTPPSLP